jgi:hypothetical protein
MRTFDGPGNTILIELTPEEVIAINRIFVLAMQAIDPSPEVTDIFIEWPSALARDKQRRPGALLSDAPR